jgi:hypothetical protein
MLSSKLDPRRVEADAAKGSRLGRHPCFAIVIRLIVQTVASIAPNLFVAAGNAGGCDFIVSWTIQDPLFLALQLKPIGIERPDGHVTDTLITAFSDLYGVVDIFRPTYLNAPLKATRGPPLRVDQIFEKVRPPTHGAKFPRSPWFF